MGGKVVSLQIGEMENSLRGALRKKKTEGEK